MTKIDERCAAYIKLLYEELQPAMGCTEPAAVAFACAKAREILAKLPDKAELKVSGNIVKNVKSVIVPNTGGKKGLAAAAAAGIVAADSSQELECLAGLTDEDRTDIDAYLAREAINVDISDSGRAFDVDVTVYAGADSARVRLADSHTNIVYLRRNDEILLDIPLSEIKEIQEEALLTVEGIVEFADCVDVNEIREPLLRQIKLNTNISAAGLANPCGASIGRVILNAYGAEDVRIRAKARAAAGADARMSGCDLPVVIVSGSGNQGITASVPLAEYADTYRTGQERLLRALAVSNLLTVHQKTGVGRLSAFCGAIYAAAAAAAGIAYLLGGGVDDVAHTLVNALAIVSGMVCDGAKPSCAAKVAVALDAGLLGYEMYKNGFQFYSGDGLVKKGVENTIHNIARLAGKGMAEADKEILRIMIE